MEGHDDQLAPRQQIVWSDLIKSHHTQLRQQFEALATSADQTGTPLSTDASGVQTTAATTTTETATVTAHPKPAVVPHTGTDAGTDELLRWQRALELPGAAQERRAYASAMHDLATQSWAADAANSPCAESEPDVISPALSSGCKRSRDGQSTSGAEAAAAAAARRQNDRILYCLDCISSYFLGRPTDGSEAAYAESLPTILSRPLKPLRKDFYQRHQRMATAAELDTMIDDLTNGEKQQCPAWQRAVRYRSLCRSEPTRAPSTFPPLRVLDVGSCYGPFADRAATHPVRGPVPLRVTSIDLEPYRTPSGTTDVACADSVPRVLKGDWLSMPFYGPETACDTAENTTHRAASKVSWRHDGAVLVKDGADGVSTAEGLRVGAYDAVIFCLLLSYMPSPRLRYRACLHAFLALEEDGLLVILSTRTQGSRRRPWTEEWTDALAPIGFERVHKSVRGKIVGLTFARRTAGRPAVPAAHSTDDSPHWDTLETQLSSAHGRQVWMEALLSTPEAEGGLTITADGVAAAL